MEKQRAKISSLPVFLQKPKFLVNPSIMETYAWGKDTWALTGTYALAPQFPFQLPIVQIPFCHVTRLC